MTAAKPFAVSADGTDLHATDVGQGRPILIVHGGMQRASRWEDTAELLAHRWRIIALERRVYGLSGEPQSAYSFAREAEDVVALLEAIGEPAIVLGHSSGGVATLEAALRKPPTGLMLYEPPVPLKHLHFGDDLARADAALASGDADEALRIFFVDMVGIPPEWAAHMQNNPDYPGGWAEMMRLLPMQLEDVRAMRGLPHDVDRYAAIAVPTLLIEGEMSPPHLRQRLAVLHKALPHSELTTINGHGHSANLEAPDLMAEIIDGFASRVFAAAQAAA
jgi:pimeloyl-ACP methyl ester carboxylesterase